MKNRSMWYDTDGAPIQAHGGCILQYGDLYYWYGENKGADNCPGTRRVDLIGVSCYVSSNLHDWKYLGLCLSAAREEGSPLSPSGVLERPKVLYCEASRQFVMWMHLDTADYAMASVGIAVSQRPEGPFHLIDVKRPLGMESRDMTVFCDSDKLAYLVFSTDHNRTVGIARLTEDYLDTDGSFVAVMREQSREAPALCRNRELYYMITSGCTGWRPNSALYAKAKSVMDERWRLIDNPCQGKDYRQTFLGQSSFIFEVNGAPYLMLDHWQPYDLKSSGYSILPICFDEDGTMSIPWVEEWNGI